MHRCRTHNVEYADYCVFCAEEHHLSRSWKNFLWLSAIAAFFLLVLILSLKYYV
jgi:hypothetical protein